LLQDRIFLTETFFRLKTIVYPNFLGTSPNLLMSQKDYKNRDTSKDILEKDPKGYHNYNNSGNYSNNLTTSTQHQTHLTGTLGYKNYRSDLSPDIKKYKTAVSYNATNLSNQLQNQNIPTSSTHCQKIQKHTASVNISPFNVGPTYVQNPDNENLTPSELNIALNKENFNNNENLTKLLTDNSSGNSLRDLDMQKHGKYSSQGTKTDIAHLTSKLINANKSTSRSKKNVYDSPRTLNYGPIENPNLQKSIGGGRPQSGYGNAKTYKNHPNNVRDPPSDIGYIPNNYSQSSKNRHCEKNS
jgi:hypothetical protein